MSITSVRDARRLMVEADPFAAPVSRKRSQAFACKMATRTAVVKGATKRVFEGHASTYEQGYRMWDWLGEYTEIVSTGAGAKSLAAGPDVVFLINHRGLALARTTNGSLELDEDATGLHDLAYTNPERSDVSDFATAVDDGVVTEQSFAFDITRGQWSPDYTEYRINEYDIDRGDVSGVTFGANPTTDIAARSSEIMRYLDYLPPGAAREAMRRLRARIELDPTAADEHEHGERGALVDRAAVAASLPAARGRSVSQLAALLDLGR